MKMLRFLSLGIVMIALAISCSSRKAHKNSPLVNNYIYAYTSGTISKSDPVRIRFANPVCALDMVGKPIPNGVFSVQPALKGQAIWEDTHTLLFAPQEVLKNKINYIGSIRLDKIFSNVPTEAGIFEFEFKTREQFFDVKIEGLQAVDMNDLKKQQIYGTLTTADAAEKEDCAAILNAKQNGKELSIGWTHSEDKRAHNFYINDIVRGDSESLVEINWNGNPLNIDNKGNASYKIPSLSNFCVVDAKVIQGDDQYVLVNFSDPIDPDQSLEGLIHFSNYKGVCRYIKDKNFVRVYPALRIVGQDKIICESGIKNTAAKPLPLLNEWTLQFEDLKPAVRLAGKGNIMPNSNGLMFPFEACNLHSVDIEIFKIFNNNIMQFLQTADLDTKYSYDLERVGRIILQKKLNLNEINPSGNKSGFVRYTLDLSKLIQADPSAVYQVRIGYRKSYSTYACNENSSNENLALSSDDFQKDSDGQMQSILDGMNYYASEDGEEYNYENRDNPCKREYFDPQKFVRRNVMSSNLGIIAKIGNDKSVFTAVTDLRTAKGVAGAQVDFYDYQQQVIATAKTDADGVAKLQLDRNPFVCMVNQGSEKGFLKLGDGYSNSLSRFDVAGDVVQKGLKGFIYGERGVWRPGDSIFLNFILDDKNNQLPANYPITFELKDPRGQLQQRFTSTKSINNVYDLTTFTRADAPTGNYMATVKVGGAIFEKTLMIETVQPNRLKIKMDFKGKNELSTEDKMGTLQANWLTGPAAQGLNAKVEVALKPVFTKFDKYENFIFDDPARSFFSEPQSIFDGNLNNDGFANVNLKLDLKDKDVPGKLQANFKVRVFERGGGFSVDNFAMPFYTYDAYVGVNVPRNKFNSKEAEVNRALNAEFAVVDKKGNPIRNTTVEVAVYRVQWRWWWDNNEDNVSQYNRDLSTDAVVRQTIKTDDKGMALLPFKVGQWGRYFVHAIHPESGHASGDFFNAGYPWDDEAFEPDQSSRAAAAMLNFKADKDKYKMGETVTLDIPTGEVGRCLITIESGSKVIEHYWMDAKAGNNKFTFKTTTAMCPTVYAHVALIQPHAQVKNDLPMRMYGVVPIHIEDASTRLIPTLTMPEVLEPEQKYTVEVAEAGGNAMTYTLAIVDEGLLDLTRFKTPDPWASFYAREALGVKTWDIYDFVMGAYGGQLERILSIGGDGLNRKSGENNRANRFKPVVIHLGPFYLEKGKRARHNIKLPNYIGAVRTMVVASQKGAYGFAEKSTPVRKPLMLLATLPRILGPGEQLKLPVDIFAMENKVKNVKVSVVESSGLIGIIGNSSQNLSFDKPGEKMSAFEIKVNEVEGVAKFKIIAEGGGEKAEQEIEIEVRNPNPYITNIQDKALQAGESCNLNVDAVGNQGTNEAMIEISSIPALHLGDKLKYLLEYPHGCVEQTVSAAFPQLYVGKFMDLSQMQKDMAYNNIKAAISSLSRFQTDNGGFGYWPGDRQSNAWASTYAGHFLSEAQKNGYMLPPNMMEKWKNYQLNMARRWDPIYYDGYYYDDNGRQLDQAYRLYTLALAGTAELGAMNRLREMKNLGQTPRWRLAAAYCLIGKPEIAKELTNNQNKSVNPYREMSYSFGSDVRDEAQILETMVLMGDFNNAGILARSISDKLNKSWYATQSVAQALVSLSKLLGNNTSEESVRYTYKLGNNNEINAGSKVAIVQVPIDVDKGVRKVAVSNKGKNLMFVRLINRGKPSASTGQAMTTGHLKMSVSYKNMKGETIDPTQIQQGTDFTAEVSITNPGSLYNYYKEMALTQVFPGGWEIHNSRMSGVNYGSSSSFDYQDIRDDRVNTYFDLNHNQTVTYRVQLNAAYAGRYYLPIVNCEAMYDQNIFARTSGMWVNVVGKTQG
ncbi:MAG: alpha-2-macroglobulin family protein [Saprospiraceae bacterium]